MPREITGLQGRSLSEEAELRFILSMVPKDGSLLKVGTFDGVSARWMSDQRPDIRILSVDPFPCKVCTDGHVHLWWQNHNPATQNLFVGTFNDLIRVVGPMPFDVVFIDGDHSFECTMDDLNCAHTMSGTIITGHDYRDPSQDGVKPAVDAFCLQHELKMDLCGSAYRLRRDLA